jgi:DNA-binding NtrC family response regulator
VRHFIAEFCRREKIAPPVLDPEALDLLLAYEFPGNVRELQNLIEGAVSLADGAIDADLLRTLIGGTEEESADPLDLESVERRHIARVLRLVGGNKSAAARALGIDRRTLQRKGF